jgi:hypothetical protein
VVYHVSVRCPSTPSGQEFNVANDETATDTVRGAIRRTIEDEAAWEDILDQEVKSLALCQKGRSRTGWGESGEKVPPELEVACRDLLQQALLAVEWCPLSAEEARRLPRVMRTAASQEEREDVDAQLEAQGVPIEVPRAIGKIEPAWGSGGAAIAALFHAPWWGQSLYVLLRDLDQATMLKVHIYGVAHLEVPEDRPVIVSLTVVPNGWEPLPVKTGECIILSLREDRAGQQRVQSVVLNCTAEFTRTINLRVSAEVAEKLEPYITVARAIELGFGCATLPGPGFDEDVDRLMANRD